MKTEQMSLFEFTETAIKYDDPDKITYADWLDNVKRFVMIERSHQWHLGDLLNFGEAKFGDKYHQVINDFGVDGQTIANWKWVANKVPPNVRRKDLTFQHHMNVAKLEPEDQAKWLEKAAKGEWPAGELRSRLKIALDRARARELEKEDEDRAELPEDDGRYRVILVDPDWREVTMESLEAMRLPALEDAVVFVLCPPDKLREAITALEMWNFAFRSSAVIDLGKATGKSWFRQQHECLIVATRGEVREPSAERISASIIRGKIKKNDERPEELYNVIEQMFPARGKRPTRLDLFGKTPREGWALWTPAEAEAATE